MPDEPLGPNPYVGPRPFHAGEALFGRAPEVRDLYYLLNAERIVLLYSPSGAGKSSLVQAGLIPQLKQGSFDVWPTVRVNSEPPKGSTVNRYVRSTILSLEEELPERLRRPAETLDSLTLEQYVLTRARKKAAPPNVTLIFDQFEEILTIDPLDIEGKRAFFTELGDLLRHREFWALFAIREDYLAPLDPYKPLVPTQLRNRFRLDLLGLEAAKEAMEQPAQTAGRVFAAGVAEDLVRDLAAVSVQQPDGNFVRRSGHTVEPVQLQVVCRRLWDELPADDRSIDPQDVARFGDVTQALGAYYDLSVAQAAGGERNQERAIREWFGDALITRGVIRGQVMQGVDASEGLDNATIHRLLDTHLVRAEKRRGATWYELAHDRLIEPVRRSNKVWFETRLEEFERRASLWEKEDHPDGLLLLGADLLKAEAKKSGNDLERRFLGASRARQTAVEADLRKARWIRWLAIVSVVVGLAAVVTATIAWRQKGRLAESNAKLAGLNSSLAGFNAESNRQRLILKRTVDQLEAEKIRTQTALDEAARQLGYASQARKARDTLFIDLLTQISLSQAIDKEAVPGGVEALAPGWTTLIDAPAQYSPRNARIPFAIARSSIQGSKGRVLAVGHNGFLVYGYPDPGRPNAPAPRNIFLKGALLWLQGDRRPVVFVSTKPTDAFLIYEPRKYPWVRSKFIEWGYEVLEGDDLSDQAKLSQAGVVIVGNAWGAFSTKELDALEAFVNEGGGLLAVGLGWSWRDYGRTDKTLPMSAYPMNRLLTRFGARFTEQTLGFR